MTVLAIDLGGTKLSMAAFSAEGKILHKATTHLEHRQGKEVGQLIREEIKRLRSETEIYFQSVGIIVPGIYRQKSGTVWAPNIAGWDDYPLLEEMQQAMDVRVVIDSDRAGYILGEAWQGNAKGCNHAIYLAVGTGIGAGILIDNKVLRGAYDIAGAIGWMALRPPFEEKYKGCGCFEYHASGEGLAKVAREMVAAHAEDNSVLQKPGSLTAHNVFIAYEKNDSVAQKVIKEGIQYWGMAIANLVSLFNPEKIILGGGVFGPAVPLIPAIREEATKWAQPISMQQVSIEPSALGGDAGLYGAGFLAFQHLNSVKDV